MAKGHIQTTIRLTPGFYKRLRIAMLHLEIGNFNILMRKLLNEWLASAEKKIQNAKR